MQIRRKRTKTEAQKAKLRDRVRVNRIKRIKREEKENNEISREIFALQEFVIA